MIGCFTDPYPDELFYSICARYHDRVQYGDAGHMTLRELFGTETAISSIALPNHLSYLSQTLPPGHRYTADYFIDNHTLLPFYSPFLTSDRVERIRTTMSGHSGSTSDKIAGITPSSIHAPDKLKYCLACVESDTEGYGEPYWHRIHQALGLEVCPAHLTFLSISSVRTRNRYSSQELISAKKGLFTATKQEDPGATLRSLDLRDHESEVLFRLAKDIAWLFNQTNLIFGFETLHKCYVSSLAEINLTLGNSRVNISKLLKSFNNYYPASFLERLQCEVDERKPSTWLSRLHKDFGLNKANHPLRHLLLIQFLGYTAEEFSEKCISSRYAEPAIDFKPFGEPPWPCLNPVCKHFRKPKINECQTYYIRSKAGDNLPRGLFGCSCGFTYARTDADKSLEDRFRIDRIESFGEAWDKYLEKLWEDSSLSMREIARQLNSRHGVVKKQAVRLKLKFPRKGQGSGTKFVEFDPRLVPKEKDSQSTVQRELEIRRAEWLCVRSEFPEATRRFLIREYQSLHDWLRRHDGGASHLCRNINRQADR